MNYMTLAIMPDIARQILSFNTLYHNRIASSHTGGLPSGLSLTEGRVLLELLAQDQLTSRQLIERLGLDAGYLSRMVSGFEKKRWVGKQASLRDRRATLLTLTSRGRAIARDVETALLAQASRMLATLTPGQQQEMAEAMGRIAKLLSGEASKSPLLVRPLKLGDAGWIIHRHAALIAVENGWDEKFEALTAQILADFIRNYDRSMERSWIAERDGQILGSLFLVRQDDETAKLRLLYVEAAARGTGLATRLLERAIRFAQERGYKKLQLFTTSKNEAARRIYQRLHFARISEEPTDLFGEGLMGEIWELTL